MEPIKHLLYQNNILHVKIPLLCVVNKVQKVEIFQFWARIVHTLNPNTGHHIFGGTLCKKKFTKTYTREGQAIGGKDLGPHGALWSGKAQT